MKVFKVEMHSIDGRVSTVEIEAKTKSAAIHKWEKLFGGFWVIIKVCY